MSLRRAQLWIVGLALTTVTAAHADVPRIWVRVVMPEAGQALIYDGRADSYRLVEAGTRLGPFTVEQITEEQLVLIDRNTRERYVYPAVNAPPSVRRRVTTATAPVAVTKDTATRTAGPVDPYPTPPAGPPATPTPVDPYAHLSNAKVSASSSKPATPADPYAHIPTAKIVPTTPTTPAPADPYANIPSAKVVVDASASPTTPVDPYGSTAPVVDPLADVPAPIATPADPYANSPARVDKRRWKPLKRRTLEQTLVDFDTLERDITLTPSPNGFKLTKVRNGSLFHKLGFRRDDVVLSVNGATVRTLDDAAVIYGQLSKRSTLEITVARGKKHVVLRFRLR